MKPESGLAFELSRLQDSIKVRDRELDVARKETTTLRSSLAGVQRMLEQRSLEADRVKERMLKAEGMAAAHAKELELLRVDKRKLESLVSDLQRQTEKFKERITALSNKGPGVMPEQVAALQSEAKLLKKANTQLTEDHKAVVSAIRAKDRQLELDMAKLNAAAATADRLHSVEGELAAAKKGLQQAEAEMRTLQQVQRVKEGDILALSKGLNTSKAALEAARAELSTTQAALRASEAALAKANHELAVTRDELTRAASVAARAAAADARLVKSEGTVPAGQHLEEVKYLSGTIGRLKDKLAAAEREATVAHAIKERYRSALQAANISLADLDASADAAATAAAAGRGCSVGGRSSMGGVGVRRSVGGPAAAGDGGLQQELSKLRLQEEGGAAAPASGGSSKGSKRGGKAGRRGGKKAAAAADAAGAESEAAPLPHEATVEAAAAEAEVAAPPSPPAAAAAAAVAAAAVPAAGGDSPADAPVAGAADSPVKATRGGRGRGKAAKSAATAPAAADVDTSEVAHKAAAAAAADEAQHAATRRTTRRTRAGACDQQAE